MSLTKRNKYKQKGGVLSLTENEKDILKDILNISNQPIATKDDFIKKNAFINSIDKKIEVLIGEEKGEEGEEGEEFKRINEDSQFRKIDHYSNNTAVYNPEFNDTLQKINEILSKKDNVNTMYVEIGKVFNNFVCYINDYDIRCKKHIIYINMVRVWNKKILWFKLLKTIQLMLIGIGNCDASFFSRNSLKLLKEFRGSTLTAIKKITKPSVAQTSVAQTSVAQTSVAQTSVVKPKTDETVEKLLDVIADFAESAYKTGKSIATATSSAVEPIVAKTKDKIDFIFNGEDSDDFINEVSNIQGVVDLPIVQEPVKKYNANELTITNINLTRTRCINFINMFSNNIVSYKELDNKIKNTPNWLLNPALITSLNLFVGTFMNLENISGKLAVDPTVIKYTDKLNEDYNKYSLSKIPVTASAVGTFIASSLTPIISFVALSVFTAIYHSEVVQNKIKNKEINDEFIKSKKFFYTTYNEDKSLASIECSVGDNPEDYYQKFEVADDQSLQYEKFAIDNYDNVLTYIEEFNNIYKIICETPLEQDEPPVVIPDVNIPPESFKMIANLDKEENEIKEYLEKINISSKDINLSDPKVKNYINRMRGFIKQKLNLTENCDSAIKNKQTQLQPLKVAFNAGNYDSIKDSLCGRHDHQLGEIKNQEGIDQSSVLAPRRRAYDPSNDTQLYELHSKLQPRDWRNPTQEERDAIYAAIPEYLGYYGYNSCDLNDKHFKDTFFNLLEGVRKLLPSVQAISNIKASCKKATGGSRKNKRSRKGKKTQHKRPRKGKKTQNKRSRKGKTHKRR